MAFFRVTIVSVAAALLVAAGGASAAVPGELDPTFGVGGKVQAPFGPESFAGGVAVQADGRILAAGSPHASAGFSVARLLANGSLDPSWGSGGVATTPLGGFSFTEDVAVQPDGKVVVVGEAPGPENEDFGIVRYLSNGQLDPGFGEGGIVILPVGALGDQAHSVAIGPGGRIAVVGVAERPSFRDAVGVAMLEPDGTPEAAFAGDGTTVIQTESEEDDRGEGVAFQPDGKIVVADATGGGAGDGFTLIRLGLDGKPDLSFGGDGVVETPIPGEGEVVGGRVSDVVVQPDGKIVGGGYGVDYVGEPPDYITNFTVARYTEEGELDQGFGTTGGIVSVRLPGEDSFGRALGLAANGKLILGGTYDVSENPLEEHAAPALVRFNPNGSLDSSFGSGGVVLGTLGAGVEEEALERLALQPDGKIVTAGDRYQEPGGDSDIISRYIANPETALPPPPPKDLPPHSKIKGVPRKVHRDALKGFHGTASDPDGRVTKVQVALVRLPSRGKARTSAAIKPRKWRTAKGTSKWALKLKHPLAPGRYVVFSRAIDNQGLAETKFSRRAHNRYRFHVLPAAR